MRTPTDMPSASRLQLAVMCPASQALPHIDSHHEAGDEGNELHELLRRELMMLRSPDERQQESKWLDAVLETIGDRLDVGLSAEMAYGFDTATGATVFHGAAIGRNYPATTPTTINGSVDYVSVGTEKALAVDLKSGLMEQPPVKRLQQLRFAALVVGMWTGLPTQTAILHAPRDGRRPWWEWGPTYDALDLVEVSDVFKAMATRVEHARRDVAAGRTPRLTTGGHCDFCPARLRCPAQVEQIQLWASKPTQANAALEQLMDVETAGVAWARIEAVEAAIREAKRKLYAFASVQPVPLPDGRMLGKHRKQGRSEVDVERLWPWLVERIGIDGAREAVTMKASKTSVRDAVGGRAGKGQKRTAGDAAIRELEAAGVIADKWTEEVGPYDPTEEHTPPRAAITAGQEAGQ